jgi:hypothetical protein
MMKPSMMKALNDEAINDEAKAVNHAPKKGPCPSQD